MPGPSPNAGVASEATGAPLAVSSTEVGCLFHLFGKGGGFPLRFRSMVAALAQSVSVQDEHNFLQRLAFRLNHLAIADVADDLRESDIKDFVSIVVLHPYMAQSIGTKGANELRACESHDAATRWSFHLVVHLRLVVINRTRNADSVTRTRRPGACDDVVTRVSSALM